MRLNIVKPNPLWRLRSPVYSVVFGYVRVSGAALQGFITPRSAVQARPPLPLISTLSIVYERPGRDRPLSFGRMVTGW
jgi:hypothetical protein